MSENFVVKVPAAAHLELLTLFNSATQEERIETLRVSNWRSTGLPYTEIIIALASTASLRALSTIIKTYLDRTRGTFEIKSERTGIKLKFDGPLDQVPLEELRVLLNQGGRSAESHEKRSTVGDGSTKR